MKYVYVTILKSLIGISSPVITGVYATRELAEEAIALPEGYDNSGLCREVIEEYALHE